MALKDRFNSILDEIKTNEGAYARIAVVGQPGAGKSSLINNLLGKRVAETGQTTDVTTEANEYEYHFQKIVDLPGYGTKMFKFDDWREKFQPQKYDVYIFVFRGKLHEEDSRLFTEIKNYNAERRRPIFLVRNHCTDIETDADKNKIRADIFAKTSGLDVGELFFVDCGRYKTGIDELRAALVETDFKTLWQTKLRTAYVKAKDEYLSAANSRAESEISTYNKIAGVNGLNPILGADVAVDLGIYFKMFADIRKCYDIEEGDMKYYALPIAKKLLELLTKEGVAILLKNFAGRQMVKSVAKYIPFVGQAAAAAIGYKMADYAGNSYSEDCFKFADGVMDKLIAEKISEFENEIPLLAAKN